MPSTVLNTLNILVHSIFTAMSEKDSFFSLFVEAPRGSVTRLG